MNRKRVVWAAAVLLAAAGIVRAAETDAFMGTWKLNEAKSKAAAGMPKNSTVVYAMDGDNLKVSIDGTDANGMPYKSEWTGKLDGKDYPITGDSSNDARAYKLVNSHTLLVTSKKGGKVTSTARIVVSADGKTRTVSVNGTNASGKKVTSTSVYDKQ